MSKQGELIDMAAVTDWKAVYAAAAPSDKRIVDYVAKHPGVGRSELARGTGLSTRTLDFRLWELAGRSTGGHAADGLLIAERAKPSSPWRYYARER